MTMQNRPRREGIRERIRFSLALRLNLNAMARLLSALITINLAFAGICVTAIALQIEDRSGRAALALRKEEDAAARSRMAIWLSDVTSSLVTIDPYGEAWKETVLEDGNTSLEWTEKLGLAGLAAAPEARRELITPDAPTTLPPLDWLESLTYKIRYPLTASGGITETVVTVSSPLWPGILFSVTAMMALTVLEFFVILGSAPAGARSARRILRPIDEMTEITRNINASRLDTRLNLRGSQNELKDLAGTINDMLERIHTAYRSQIRFVSDASHELRTPIAVIQGYANLLDRWGKNDPQTLQESIAALKSESESMKELVEKLLFLARGDNNTLTLHMEPLYVDRLIGLLLRETTMIDQNHVFRISREEHLAVVADAQLLKQALRILIDNSIKYTPAKNEITLSCSAEAGAMVRISVQDSGIGIPAADVPYIFDRFYRADESRARKSGGTGLGLSIAKWIVERHNGRIEVLSRQGFGTRMSIILPRLTDSAQLKTAETVQTDAVVPDGATSSTFDHPLPPDLVR